MESPSVDHENTPRHHPHRTASTCRHAILRGVGRAPYQSHSGMFNGAQSVTISAGV
jgi:hypothetical protein